MTRHSTKEEKNKLRKHYEEDFNKIETLVNEWDPIGLIARGAPKDEYDCLTAKLIISLYNNQNEKEMTELILNEMESHFDYPITEAKASEFVKKIIEKKYKETI